MTSFALGGTETLSCPSTSRNSLWEGWIVISSGSDWGSRKGRRERGLCPQGTQVQQSRLGDAFPSGFHCSAVPGPVEVWAVVPVKIGCCNKQLFWSVVDPRVFSGLQRNVQAHTFTKQVKYDFITRCKEENFQPGWISSESKV